MPRTNSSRWRRSSRVLPSRWRGGWSSINKSDGKAQEKYSCDDGSGLYTRQMLSVQGVVKSFGGFRALNGCVLEIKAGGITGIMGPNGAGKSTLFNVIGGIIPPDEGAVVMEGENVGGLAPHRLAARGLVRTFQ